MRYITHGNILNHGPRWNILEQRGTLEIMEPRDCSCLFGNNNTASSRRIHQHRGPQPPEPNIPEKCFLVLPGGSSSGLLSPQLPGVLRELKTSLPTLCPYWVRRRKQAKRLRIAGLGCGGNDLKVLGGKSMHWTYSSTQMISSEQKRVSNQTRKQRRKKQVWNWPP